MRRTVTTLGLVGAMLLAAAFPAMAAPNNKNTTVLDVVCGGEEIQLRPNPGRGGPAWDVETGEHQVGKRFSGSETVTVTIITGASSGDFVSETNEFVEDHGAEKGNKDLVECTTGDTFVPFEGEIDEGFADALNADFGTTIFEAGQEVSITVEFTLTVLALFTGK